MRKTEDAIQSHRQSAQVATSLDYDANDVEQSQRDGYADLLSNLGDKYPKLVVIDADLSTVGKTFAFANKWPERHLQVGIAEQNMMGIAAGIAQFGMTPVVHSLAVFAIGRAFDQIRESICYSELAVKIIGLHAGATLSPDGATHQTMEDISLMTSLPNMCVVAPADANQTRELLPSIIESKLPVYYRLLFPKMKNVTVGNKASFGKIQILKGGSKMCFFSYGQTLHPCLEVAEEIEKLRGIRCSVVNIHTIKPIDEEGIIEILNEFEKIIVVEEHNIFGGLGSIISTISSKHCPRKMRHINTKDQFGITGLPVESLKSFGLDKKNIFLEALKFMDEK